MTRNLVALILLAVLASVFAGLVVGYVPDTALNVTADYYATNTAKDIGAPNIVTAIIVTYRGLDTLGEVTVLFLSAAIVALVLRQDMQKTKRPSNYPAGELLHTGTRLLVPLVLLSGSYVFMNGHLTPGGGFQGGAIIASAILLMLLTDPLKRFSHRLVARLESISGLFYVGLGILGIMFAGGLLDNRILPLGEFGSLLSAGAIPLIYSLIGIKVGAEFSSILVSLSETEDT